MTTAYKSYLSDVKEEEQRTRIFSAAKLAFKSVIVAVKVTYI